jgi:hypothetical protein
MAFDSLNLLSTCVLFAASVAAWILSAPLRAGARLYLRFAAILFAGLAVSVPLGLSSTVILLLLPLAAGALMVASFALFAAPLPSLAASIALTAALGCGFAAMLSGYVIPALAAVLFAGLCIITVALNAMAVIAVLAGAALLAAGLVLLERGAADALLLFSAAALIGLARQSGEAQLLRSSTSALRGQSMLP